MSTLEDRLYQSYLKAEAHQNYGDPDRLKRHPELTASEIRNANRHDQNILVTGSKGKGSVSHFIAFLLEQFYITGLFTSPHILDMRERIQVNHRWIDVDSYHRLLEEETDYYLKKDQDLPEDVGISPLGILCTMAVKYFAEAKTEWNVMEYGKGVAYDDVNALPRQIGVIQPIFLEHTRELGPTLADIAGNKAEIMKPGMKACYTGKQSPEVLAILRRKAQETGVPLLEFDKDFSITYCEAIEDTGKYQVRVRFSDGVETSPLTVPMPGKRQAENFALALAVAYHVLKDRLLNLISEKDFQTKLAKLQIVGRLQCLREQPLVLMDACINGASAKAIVEEYETHRFRTIVVIPADKDYLGVCREAAKISSVIILSKTKSPHYHFSEEQALKVAALPEIKDRGIHVTYVGDLEALFALSEETTQEMLLLGSTTMISAYAEWKGQKHE